MALSESQARKRNEAVAPLLEPDETIRGSFLGQTPVPPWTFLLIAPYLFIFMQKYRTVVLTDRNIYVMHNAYLRTYKFKGVAHKSPLATAQIERGETYLSIDGGPKLMVPPFGPIKRGLTDLAAALYQTPQA